MRENAAAALDWARSLLAEQPSAEPLDAAVLLAHVLGVDRASLIAHPEQALTPDQAVLYRALVQQRAAGMPVAYLVGQRPFYDRMLAVNPHVLIPRPETEHLVDAALAWLRARSAGAAPQIVDVGTGSGAIAVTLAAHVPAAWVWAVDVSPDALAVAALNAQRAALAHPIRFLSGDLLEPVIAAGLVMDLIAANLPYIPSAEVDRLAVALHEPRLALDGGPDGLDLLRRLLAQAPRVLAANGLILLEIMAGQGAAVSTLAAEKFPGAVVRVIRDYAGHERVVSLQRG